MDCIMFKEYRIRCIQELIWYGLYLVFHLFVYLHIRWNAEHGDLRVRITTISYVFI